MFADISSKALKRFFETSPIPLSLSSPVFDDCPLVLVNHAFEDLTGYRADEIIGQNCRILQGELTEPEAKLDLRASIDGRRDALVQITNYRKDGTRFDNLVFLLPIFGESGSLMYYLGSQCDMSPPDKMRSPREHLRILDVGLTETVPDLATDDRLRPPARALWEDQLNTVGGSRR